MFFLIYFFVLIDKFSDWDLLSLSFTCRVYFQKCPGKILSITPEVHQLGKILFYYRFKFCWMQCATYTFLYTSQCLIEVMKHVRYYSHEKDKNYCYSQEKK